MLLHLQRDIKERKKILFNGRKYLYTAKFPDLIVSDTL